MTTVTVETQSQAEAAERTQVTISGTVCFLAQHFELAVENKPILSTFNQGAPKKKAVIRDLYKLLLLQMFQPAMLHSHYCSKY